MSEDTTKCIRMYESDILNKKMQIHIKMQLSNNEYIQLFDEIVNDTNLSIQDRFIKLIELIKRWLNAEIYWKRDFRYFYR